MKLLGLNSPEIFIILVVLLSILGTKRIEKGFLLFKKFLKFLLTKEEKVEVELKSEEPETIEVKEEKVEADKKVLAELINKHFPDWRRVLNECQRYAVSGKIDSGILAAFSDVAVNDLIKNLKQKNFSEVRKWVVTNMDNDTSVLLRRIYDSLYDSLEHSSIPAAVLIIAKYQYQIAFVADQEINLLAALTEIMVECEFK